MIVVLLEMVWPMSEAGLLILLLIYMWNDKAAKSSRVVRVSVAVASAVLGVVTYYGVIYVSLLSYDRIPDGTEVLHAVAAGSTVLVVVAVGGGAVLSLLLKHVRFGW